MFDHDAAFYALSYATVTGVVLVVLVYTLSGKWLELLKHIAPGVTRVAVLRDAATWK